MTTAEDPPSAAFPWRPFRRERLVLVLVALAALTPVYSISTQDSSRLCLSRALSAGHLAITSCVGQGVDRSRYRGRLYSDKAPGVALLAVPAVVVTALPATKHWHYERDLRVWLTRIWTNGLPFLLLVFALGRIAEGLVPRSGAFTAVTFALGTTATGLAATSFDQVLTAALLFGAFALAWRGRDVAAGLLAGAAVLTEYQAALGLAVIAVYLAARGARRVPLFLMAAAPGCALLALYDWAAFGSPFHASYRYVANGYARAQASGFFGISFPRGHSVLETLIGNRGLLFASPVLVLAAAGLVLFARRYRLEAIACGTVAALFGLLEVGYFLPYGGISPGPRFLIPGLPFLALGLGGALVRARRVTIAAAAVSVACSTLLELTWANGGTLAVLAHPDRLRGQLTANVLPFGTVGSALVVSCCAAFAFVLVRPARTSIEIPGSQSKPRRRYLARTADAFTNPAAAAEDSTTR